MKIDTSKIENYANLSVEEKLKALEAAEFDTSGYVEKALFDKKASEAAEAARKLKEKQTDDEKAAEAAKQRDEEFKALQRKVAVTEYKAQYLAMGYDEKLAQETAEAVFDGDMKKVFANQASFNKAYETKLRADIVKGDPKPGGAGASGGVEKTEAEKLAEKIGKTDSEAAKTYSDVMKNYF